MITTDRILIETLPADGGNPERVKVAQIIEKNGKEVEGRVVYGRTEDEALKRYAKFMGGDMTVFVGNAEKR